VSRWEGSLSSLRQTAIAALAARAALVGAVDQEPPDTGGLAPDPLVAGRVFVGVSALTARQSGRADTPAEMVLSTITLTARGYVRRQPSDRTRVSGDGVAHSYDECLDRAELILLALYYAIPVSTSTIAVLQEEQLWRLEVTCQVEWTPTVLGAP